MIFAKRENFCAKMYKNYPCNLGQSSFMTTSKGLYLGKRSFYG